MSLVLGMERGIFLHSSAGMIAQLFAIDTWSSSNDRLYISPK